MQETNLRTKFDWAIYADATFAGLSVLIPIPLVDMAFEWFFKRRMPGVIARRNGRTLTPAARQELKHNRRGCLQGCLGWPIRLFFEFFKRLSRKIFYFLTSPLLQLAQQVVAGVSHIFRTLRRIIRRGEEDEVVEAARQRMARNWDSLADYWAEVAADFERTYSDLAAQRPEAADAFPRR